jgi:transposase
MQMGFRIGLAWGGAAHNLCILDTQGAIATRFEVAHAAKGLTELKARLAHFGDPAELPVAIERPSGLVVEALLAAGHPVVPIHPNVVKASRPRYRAAGGKSDPGDAYLLADLLRTDGHRFRPLAPCSDEIKALRALVRGRDDLVVTRVALANQLRSLLEGFWPGAAAIFADVDSPIALAFLRRYPTPDSAARLGEERLAAFLGQHQYCGRRTPAALLPRLRASPAGLAGEAETDGKGELVRALAATLEALVTQITKLTSCIRHAVADLPDGQIVMSFPRTGRICAAQILAELDDVRERYLTADQLAAEAGLCPVTHQSGKSRGVTFRWACNRRLRQALTCFADNSRHSCAWAANIYRRARMRGCRHPRAIRILGRAWLRVLWRAWIDRQPYDPAHHAALTIPGCHGLSHSSPSSIVRSAIRSGVVSVRVRLAAVSIRRAAMTSTIPPTLARAAISASPSGTPASAVSRGRRRTSRRLSPPSAKKSASLLSGRWPSKSSNAASIARTRSAPAIGFAGSGARAMSSQSASGGVSPSTQKSSLGASDLAASRVIVLVGSATRRSASLAASASAIRSS